jgi:hypothetical protein
MEISLKNHPEFEKIEADHAAKRLAGYLAKKRKDLIQDLAAEDAAADTTIPRLRKTLREAETRQAAAEEALKAAQKNHDRCQLAAAAPREHFSGAIEGSKIRRNRILADLLEATPALGAFITMLRDEIFELDAREPDEVAHHPLGLDFEATILTNTRSIATRRLALVKLLQHVRTNEIEATADPAEVECTLTRLYEETPPVGAVEPPAARGGIR